MIVFIRLATSDKVFLFIFSIINALESLNM